MAAWTNATATTAGVLRAEELGRHVDVRRVACGAAAEPWVENYWTLRWELPDGYRYTSQVVPHPACSLTVERGHTRPGVGDEPVVSGVVTTRFDVELRGWGWVFGVKFRPGGLAALTGRSARAWRDRVVDAGDVLPDPVVAPLRRLDPLGPVTAYAREMDEVLAEVGPPDQDPLYTDLLRMITDMLADPELVAVAQLQDRYGVTARALQRLFGHYVGVGPKWVLARYRMHDVLTALDRGYNGSLTDLAHRFGWYDQAHFTRVFAATTGVTPTDYRRRTQNSLLNRGLAAGRRATPAR